MLGIDLGTTNSLAAVFVDGRTQLIQNTLGHVMTPSAVSVDASGTVLVGLAARERHATAPQDTALAFKRYMGTDHVVKLQGQKFRSEELSALVLRALKADAEAHLGHTVEEAVITVPAYFNQLQRKATQTAATLAGLKVARLLNEPTAAGLAYGLQERADHTTFLVFDLGGGTFDVSVLEYFDGVVQVRASAGDTRLGGEDFVRALLDSALSTAKLSAVHKEKLRSNGHALRAAEQAKRDLSDRVEAILQLPGGDPQTISREAFEAACSELMLRLRRPIERALGDARLNSGELGEIVLVGGATRMPMIRHAVTRLFGKLPLRTINPDETIARGAAIQAALLSRDAALEEVVLTDVMPYSLGLGIVDDRFSPIIERNMPVPVSRVGRYHTIRDHQTQLDLDICQGESPIASENLQLQRVSVSVPSLPKGEAMVDVRFTYDANGLLVVDVADVRTGEVTNVVIQQREHELVGEALAQALKALDQIKVHPREQQENAVLLERCKRLYEDRLGQERLQIQEALMAFQNALDGQDPEIIERVRGQVKKFLDEIDRGFVL